MSDEKKCFIATACMVVFMLACAMGVWVFQSMNESAVYNRLTGAETTTWDAMFVELRVQEPLIRKAASE